MIISQTISQSIWFLILSLSKERKKEAAVGGMMFLAVLQYKLWLWDKPYHQSPICVITQVNQKKLKMNGYDMQKYINFASKAGAVCSRRKKGFHWTFKIYYQSFKNTRLTDRSSVTLCIKNSFNSLMTILWINNKYFLSWVLLFQFEIYRNLHFCRQSLWSSSSSVWSPIS